MIVKVATALFLSSSALAGWWQDMWQRPDEQGYRSFIQEFYKQAAQQFDDKTWQGAAHYRSNNFAKAEEAFAADSQESAQYNLGNALAHQGKLEQALAQFEKVLVSNPQHQDAKHNRDIIKQYLEKQQQKNSSQDSSSSNEQSKESSKDNGQSDAPDKQSDNDQAKSQQQDTSSQGDDTQNHEQKNSSQQDNDDGDEQAASAAKSENHDQDQDEDSQDNQSQSNESNNQEHGKESSKEDGTAKAQGAAQEPQQSKEQDKQGESSAMPLPPDKEKAEPHNKTETVSTTEHEDHQADKQWLRRIPDEPGGLLKQKFLRDKQRRQLGDKL